MIMKLQRPLVLALTFVAWLVPTALAFFVDGVPVSLAGLALFVTLAGCISAQVILLSRTSN